MIFKRLIGDSSAFGQHNPAAFMGLHSCNESALINSIGHRVPHLDTEFRGRQ